MKGILAMLAFLAMGMLFFGCTYSSESSANYSAGGSANVSASGGPQNQPGNASSGATEPSGTSSGNGSAGAAGSGAGTAGSAGGEVLPASGDLSGKNYSDLIGTGTSSQCTVTYTDETAGAVTLDLYFNGKGSMRIEQHDTGYSDCPYALMVYKGDSSGNGMLYLTCPGHEDEALGQDFMTDTACDWQSMEISSEYGGIGSSGLGIGNGYMSPSLNFLPSPVYSCKPWTLDGSKFETPGTVCD